MPVTAGHYNLVLKGRYGDSQDVINSFFVEVDLNGGTLVGDDDELFSIGEHFWNNIATPLRTITTNNVRFNTIDVFKADGVDVGASGFYTIPFADGLGLYEGQSLPPFVSWTFQYTRPNANYRHGYKRFSGVPEAYQASGVIDSGAVTYVNNLANALKASVNLNDALIGAPFMRPALVQRVKNGVPVDPDVWYLPSTVVYKKIGSQNTRKYNVGS